jgi:hypothetical protein
MTRLLLALPALLLAVQAAPAQRPKEQQPGWPDAFPKLDNYAVQYDAPVVKRDAKNPVYSQTAHYVWTGGASREFHVTLARDAAFKTLYSEEEVKKGKPAPEKIEIGKHPAWLWKFELNRKDERPLDSKIVVLLGDDRVLVIEQRGLGPFEPVEKVAERFDLRKIKAALDQPPK